MKRLANLPNAGLHVTAALLVLCWLFQSMGHAQPLDVLPIIASSGAVLLGAAALGWMRASRVGLTAPQAMLLLGAIGMTLGLAVDVHSTPPETLTGICTQADGNLWRLLQLHAALLPWMHAGMWAGGLAAVPLLRAIRPACRGQFCAGMVQNLACSAWMTIGMSAGALLWASLAAPPGARDPAAMPAAMFGGMVWGMVASVMLYRVWLRLRFWSAAVRA